MGVNSGGVSSSPTCAYFSSCRQLPRVQYARSQLKSTACSPVPSTSVYRDLRAQLASDKPVSSSIPTLSLASTRNNVYVAPYASQLWIPPVTDSQGRGLMDASAPLIYL